MRRARWMLLAVLGCVLPGWSLPGAGPPPGLGNSRPLLPREELATFTVPKGFRVELAACEPDVVDPVAMAFDENGRLFVAEMRGYPNAGVGTGFITSGRIKVLQDADGDGFFEKSTVYADKLRFPTGVMPYKGGLLVANAPDLIYLQDTTGTGKADRSRVLYTGFDLANIQQLLNSLQWGLDNHVHACAGGAGGTIVGGSGEKPDFAPVALRGRGIRFKPDIPGSLEPTSGGGQYGLATDDFGRTFTATNSQHLRHIILPDHYLRRNPALALRQVTLDIPDHGAACKVYRKSPFEAWRVERTSRRAGGKDAKRFPSTELVPGGYITSACSPLVYSADLFPPRFRGNVLVCDPANNLIHRDVLKPSGATFVASRPEEERDCEFLTSTDNWFRPVHLTLGPDGAVYVLDFYREVIETPLSLPDDIKKRLNLQSRGRGRIWRITVEGAKRQPAPALGKATSAELVKHLASPNAWWRMTAQRLLVQRQDRSVVPALEELARKRETPLARLHALCTLEGLGALKEALIEQALTDPESGVREWALRLADDRLARSPGLQKSVCVCAGDPDPRVRFQAAFTLGQADTPALRSAWAKLARREDNDTWTRAALLSSAGKNAIGLLEALVTDKELARKPTTSRLDVLNRLAAVVGARASDAELGCVLALLGRVEGEVVPVALLDGLGQGLRSSGRPLGKLWESSAPELKEGLRQARPFFERAAAVAGDSKKPVKERTEAVRLLGRGPFAPLAGVAPGLLTPTTPPEVQLEAVRALAGQESDRVPALLLASWGAYSPAVRREVVEALFANPARLNALLDAVQKKQVQAAQIEPARLALLRKHPDAKVRARATKLLSGAAAPERAKVVAAYRPALDLKADEARGKAAFQKNCATCHRLEGVGFEVGPDLLSALRNKSAEQLLIDILDPSREVDPRYHNYTVTTTRGQVLTGLIAAETASSITLRRGEKAEDVVLRSQVESVESTGKSLMPEGLEAQLSKQDVADVIAYLLKVGAGK